MAERQMTSGRFWVGFLCGAIAAMLGTVILPFWWPAAGLLGRCLK